MGRSLAEIAQLNRAAYCLLPLWHIAIHESGHCVAGAACGREVIYIEVNDDETGRVLWEPDDADWEDEARSLLGGGLAEFLYTDRALVQLGDATDREKLDRLLIQNGAGPNAKDRLIRETTEIIKAEWPAIEALAAELVCKRSLNKEQIAAVLEVAEENS